MILTIPIFEKYGNMNVTTFPIMCRKNIVNNANFNQYVVFSFWTFRMPPKKDKTAKAEAKAKAGKKEKNTKEAKDIKQKTIHVQDAASSIKTTEVVNSAAIDSTGSDLTKIIAPDVVQNGGHNDSKRPSRKRNYVESMSSASTSTKTSTKNSTESSVSKPKVTDSAFSYEIDCTQVSNSINVTDFQRFIEQQLKVNGEKNNLGDNVTVCCRDHAVVICSKVYLPKKSLRFLSKKFLKKVWNIQVISKNKNSYEFKYVGTP